MAINPKNVQWDATPNISNVQWDSTEQDFSIPTEANLTRRRHELVNKPATGIGDVLLGAGETALSLGSAAISPLTAIPIGLAKGEKYPEALQSAVYEPRTRTGQEYTSTVADILEASKLQGAMGMPLIGKTTPILPRAESTLKTLTRQAQNVPRDKMLKEAQNIGLVAPPSKVGAGAIPRALETASGKFMFSDAASAKNSQVINDAARKYIGLPIDSPLTTETLKDLKDVYGVPYDKASSLAPTQIQSTAGGMVKSQLTRSGAEIVDDIKTTKEDANAFYRAWKSPNSDNPTEYRKQYITLSNQVKAFEAELDRLAKANNKPELLNELKDSRQKIAKVYTVENALNPELGTVDVRKIAKKDVPLSGELALAARFSKAFPDVTKPVSVQPNPLSIYDLLAISAGAGGEQPNKLLIGLPFARAAGRATAISKPFQQNMVTPKYPLPTGVSSLQTAQQALPYVPYMGLLNSINTEEQ